MENRFYYIDEKTAQSLISQAEQMTEHTKRGGNSKAFLIDGYAVLKTGNIPLFDADKFPAGQVPYDIVIAKLQELKEQGVNVVPILGYSYDPERISRYGNTEGGGHRFAYGKGYVIQPKADGIEMWDRNLMKEKEYVMKRTQTFADAPQEHFDKFAADYRDITDAGIMIDPSKKSNFFYDKQKGFSFIDMNFMMDEKQAKNQNEYMYSYCCLPVNGVFREWSMPFMKDMTEEEFRTLTQNNVAVFGKCRQAIIKNGIMTEQEIQECLQRAKDGKRAGENEKLPINVAGLTNSLKLQDCLEIIEKTL
jgi:hypothetical protein